MTWIMRPDCTIKGKPEKITVSNSQPTKIIMDKLKKPNLIQKKKLKSNYEGWDWKIISIRKSIRKNKNQKNKDQIWNKKSNSKGWTWKTNQ